MGFKKFLSLTPRKEHAGFCDHTKIEVLGVVAFVLVGVWTHQSRLDQAYWPDRTAISLS